MQFHKLTVRQWLFTLSRFWYLIL